MIQAHIPQHVTSQTVDVLDSYLHCLDSGEGEPILFLHGNPTSSYLWRNVMPLLDQNHRCIAVDMIGMGASGKPDIDYRLVDHIKYIDAFIDALDLHNFTLVMHDWGVAVGLHYAQRFEERVKALVFMEGHILSIDRWDDLDEGAQDMFKKLRTETLGQAMIIDDNFFIEAVLPSGILRTLSPEEMASYRAPYIDPDARKPLWRWPNEIPIEGKPVDVHNIVNEYNAFLVATHVSKLLLYADPGAIIRSAEVSWCKANLHNFSAADIGPGLHFLPEDRPHEIGAAIAQWLETVE